MANFFIKLINYVIAGLGASLAWVIDLFPNSPFSKPVVPTTVDLGFITWVIPFPLMIVHFAGLLGAIGSYYLVRVIARWLKVARN